MTDRGVLRRALALAQETEVSDEQQATRAELASVAQELDVPLDALAAAIAESQTGALVESGLIDRVVGPTVVWARRATSEDEEAARRRILRWLEKAHGMQPRVRPDGVVVATKRRDVLAKIQGAVRRASGLGGLGGVRGVQAAAVDVDGHPAVVCVAADVGNKRNEALAGGAALTTGGVAILSVASLAISPVVLLGVPVALGAGVVVTRLTHQSTLRSVEQEVESTVDGIASGELPPSVIGHLANRLPR